MRIPWGEEYKGEGRADPNKSRQQREEELRQIMQRDDGLDILGVLYMQATVGVHSGVVAPVGGLMIETILDHEYPPEAKK